MAKIHYADVDYGNESNPYDEWSETICGLEYTESELSNKIEDVTCKKCIKSYQKHNPSYYIHLLELKNKELKECLESIVNGSGWYDIPQSRKEEAKRLINA